MSCSIIRNSEGYIIKVLDPNTGKESKLFNQIAEIPHVKSLEEAVDIYDEILKANLNKKPEFKKDVEDEFIKISNETGTINLSETQTDFEFEGVLSEQEIEDLKVDDMLFKIDSIEVVKNKRGQGNAIKLMNEAVSEFKKSNFEHVVLNASPIGFGGLNLEDLTGFYEKFGFEVVKDQGGNRMMIASKSNIKQVNKESSSEIFFSLQSNNKEYFNFKEALDDTTEKTIDIVSNGKVIASFPSSLDERTLEGVINSFISDGIIEPNKVIFNGKTYFQTTGETYQDKKITTEFFKDAIRGVLSKSQYTVKEGLIELKEDNLEPSKEGTLHRDISDRILNYFSGDTVVNKEEKVNENNLKLNLMKILSDMGVSVISLKQYQDRFKKKNQEIPPSAEALADIANRVIAFKEGFLNLDNLTEEVMHFIVETLPKEQVEELSDFIKNSKEYQDYYEKYKEVFKGDEKLLEKEILGKILKNITLNKTANKDKSFIDRLYSIIRNFFNNLKLTQSHRDQLKQLNSLVDKLVLQQEGSNFNEDSLSNSQEIALMYSLSETVKSAGESFKTIFKNATEKRYLTSYSKELQNTTFEGLKGKELELIVSRFLEMSSRLIDTTKTALEYSKKEGRALSGQNAAILNDLSNKIQGTLSSLANELRKPQEGIKDIDKSILADKLEDNVKEIERVVASNKDVSNDSVRNMFNEILERYSEEEREVYSELIESSINGQVNDINQLFSFFGNLHHASNPLLNMIANKFWLMNMKTNQGTKEDTAGFMNFIDNNPTLKNRIQELFDHDKGFMKDKIDHSSFNAVLDILKLEAFEEVSGIKIDTLDIDVSRKYNVNTISKELGISKKSVINKLKKLESYNKLKLENKLTPISSDEQGNYQTLVKIKQMPFIETLMNESYYKEQFEKFEKLNISGATQAFLAEYSANRHYVRAISTKGKRIALTPEKRDTLNQIKKVRKDRKNIFSETSQIKRGLEISITKPSNKESVLLNTGYYLFKSDDFDKLSPVEKDFANIAFDLNKLDKDFIDKIKEKGSSINLSSSTTLRNFIDYIDTLSFKYTVDSIKEKDSLKNIEREDKVFVKENNTLYKLNADNKLEEIGKGEFENHSEEEILDVIISNLDINLSQEFYNSMNGESFLNQGVLEKLNPDKIPLIDNLRSLYAKRNAILAKHRNSYSPFEIDKITDAEQEYIKSLSLGITEGLKILKLPKNESTGDKTGEKSPNLSYKADLKNNGIQENTEAELNYILKKGHANSSNIGRLEDLYHKSSYGLTLSDANSAFLNKYKASNLTQTKLNYLKDNLYPYYTRFTPIGYKSINERLAQGDNILDIVESMFKDTFINVKIDSSFEDKDNSLKNPDFDDNYDGGFKQPKKGRFLDKEFIDKFGINEKGEATKDTNLFEARRLYIETNKKRLEKQNQKGYNPYRIIQISASKTEKVRKLFSSKNKKSTLKELFKDTFSYRVDDIAYGEPEFSDTRNLPKYYTKDLEDRNDVSTDYIHSLVEASYRGNEYREKKNIMADIDALQDTLVKSKRNPRDLKNTIAMVNSLIDGQMFGKIETRPFKIKIPGRDTPIDVTKLVRVLTKFTSLKNLGFNLIIPATSYLTASIQKRVEEFIGEKLNKDAARMASSEYKRLMTDAAKNALDFNDNSQLFLIGQAFGIYDMSSKARNAKYNLLQRTFSKSAMGAHSIANFPITPKIALGIMFDNRIVDGAIKTRQQFFQEGLRANKSKEELEVSWKTLEDNTIYKYMEFTETGFKWKKDTEKQTGLSKQYLEDRKLFLQEYIAERVADIEGQVPQGFKTQAQRHAILSTTLLHKNFLSVIGTKRLKDKQFNITSGLMEEGTWRTAGNVMGDFFNTKGNFLEKVQKLKESLTELPKKPLRKDFESADEYSKALKQYNNDVLDHELKVRNMKRLGIEMSSYMSLALIISTAMLFTDDGEEDEWWIHSVANLLMFRTLNESASNLSFNMIGDMGGVIESPVVVWNSAKKIASVWELADFRDVKSGRYKGLNRNTAYMMNILPGAKSTYDMLSAKNLRDNRKAYENYQKNVILNMSTFGIVPLFDYIKEN